MPDILTRDGLLRAAPSRAARGAGAAVRVRARSARAPRRSPGQRRRRAGAVPPARRADRRDPRALRRSPPPWPHGRSVRAPDGRKPRAGRRQRPRRRAPAAPDPLSRRGVPRAGAPRGGDRPPRRAWPARPADRCDDRGPVPRAILVTVADQAADPRGLWSADYALLSQIVGPRAIDLLATEQVLATGLHQRLHDIFPGLEELRVEPVVRRVRCSSSPPVPRRWARPLRGSCRAIARRSSPTSIRARGTRLALGSDRRRLPASAPVSLPCADGIRGRRECRIRPWTPARLPPSRSRRRWISPSRSAMSEASRAPLIDLLGLAALAVRGR